MCLGVALATISVSAIPGAISGPSFELDERERIVTYWADPARYTVTLPASAAKDGPWQVRLTPEGSQWLWNYNKARGLGKVAPTKDAGAQSPEQVAWEAWIDAKVAYDRFVAQQTANVANAEATGDPIPPLQSPPPEPGPMPSGLKSLTGAAPPFALPAQPQVHTITFDDGVRLSFTDNVPMRPRYAYYRFPQGVMSGGTRIAKMPESELAALFKKAGIDASEQRILKAVSLLEGGFDSVNTYDTGWVSVGFIQFACLTGGAGSLGEVLYRQKQDEPLAFEDDFRRFGIDVDASGRLVALDLETGDERVGPDAAREIIEDKRLIAVFQRAGRVSSAFKIAQLKVAMRRYFPADDVVTARVGDTVSAAKVRDIIRTEAGLATLMDRKVNTGKLDPLPKILEQVVAQNGLASLQEVASFEREIVDAMRWRKDYLVDASLSRPRTIYDIASRSGGARKSPRTTKPPASKPKQPVKGTGKG